MTSNMMIPTAYKPVVHHWEQAVHAPMQPSTGATLKGNILSLNEKSILMINASVWHGLTSRILTPTSNYSGEQIV